MQDRPVELFWTFYWCIYLGDVFTVLVLKMKHFLKWRFYKWRRGCWMSCSLPKSIKLLICIILSNLFCFDIKYCQARSGMGPKSLVLGTSDQPSVLERTQVRDVVSNLVSFIFKRLKSKNTRYLHNGNSKTQKIRNRAKGQKLRRYKM